MAVAEEATFPRAAERVHISQSGVSAQVPGAGERARADPFERSSRTARLTVAGSAALPHARKALDAAPALRELAAYPLGVSPRGNRHSQRARPGCAAAGHRPTIVLEASAPGAVVDLGARGLGVAVLRRSMAASCPGLPAVPIKGVEVPALLALVWRPKPAPAVAALLPIAGKLSRSP